VSTSLKSSPRGGGIFRSSAPGLMVMSPIRAGRCNIEQNRGPGEIEVDQNGKNDRYAPGRKVQGYLAHKKPPTPLDLRMAVGILLL